MFENVIFIINNFENILTNIGVVGECICALFKWVDCGKRSKTEFSEKCGWTDGRTDGPTVWWQFLQGQRPGPTGSDAGEEIEGTGSREQGADRVCCRAAARSFPNRAVERTHSPLELSLGRISGFR